MAYSYTDLSIYIDSPKATTPFRWHPLVLFLGKAMASWSSISLALVIVFSMSKAQGASSISSSRNLHAIYSMTFGLASQGPAWSASAWRWAPAPTRCRRRECAACWRGTPGAPTRAPRRRSTPRGSSTGSRRTGASRRAASIGEPSGYRRTRCWTLTSGGSCAPRSASVAAPT